MNPVRAIRRYLRIRAQLREIRDSHGGDTVFRLPARTSSSISTASAASPPASRAGERPKPLPGGGL